MIIDNSIQHVKNALDDLNKEVEKILADCSLALNKKDDLMLPIVQQKRVLTQTLKDLHKIKETPPEPNRPCGISKYRDD